MGEMVFSIPPPLPRVSDADRTAIGKFLVAGALYQKLTVPGLRFDGDSLTAILPREIQRACETAKCGSFESGWLLHKLSEDATPETAVATYCCRNCGASFEVCLRWGYSHSEKARRAREEARAKDRILRAAGGVGLGDPEPAQAEFSFQKVGQYPAPTVTLPPDFAKALGTHQDLYRKGLVSRNQGYGIGALAYFRRIVEDTMNNMLGLLAEALREHNADPDVVQRVEAANGEKVFEKKAKIAADALPADLQPGGFNPFRSLHEQYSESLHEHTDDACVAIVDRMREDMAIIFKILKTHIDDRRQYKEAARRLQQKRSRPK